MTYLNGLLDYPKIKSLVDDYGTPLHIYSSSIVNSIASSYKKVSNEYYPGIDICFASKSNPCMGAMKLAASNALGCDVVSEFELNAALQAGIASHKIYCNGNAKNDDYIRLAVKNNVNLVIDNDEELRTIEKICNEENIRCKVLIRFSGMDGLSGLTSKAQSTATHWTKFGFAFDRRFELVDYVSSSNNMEYQGPSAHIGTQLTSPNGFSTLLEEFLFFSEELFKRGIKTHKINIGGGFPVNFLNQQEWEEFKANLRNQISNQDDLEKYVTWDNLKMGYSHVPDTEKPDKNTPWIGKAFWSEHPGSIMLEKILLSTNTSEQKVLNRLKALDNPILVIEPGRSLFAPSGITAVKVNNVKTVQGHPVISVEMGIVNHGTNLIANDMFTMSVEPSGDSDEADSAFIAGQLCFSSDMVSKTKVKLNRLPVKGDLIIIHNTGAYSADHFASNSCGFPRPAKIALNEDGSIDLWRNRETFADIFGE